MIWSKSIYKHRAKETEPKQVKLVGYSSDTVEFDQNLLKPGPVHHCCYCNTMLNPKNKTRDHLHPRSLGGNITRPCCFACNQEKGDLTLDKYIIYMSIVQGTYHPGTAEYKLYELKISRAKKLLNLISK